MGRELVWIVGARVGADLGATSWGLGALPAGADQVGPLVGLLIWAEF